MKSTRGTVAVLLLLIVLVAAPRLVGIDKFATVDEPYWLTAGSDFYYALGQRAFAHTYYDYHPAVTTMWIVTAAMLVYFPQYRGFGQGYFDVYKDSLERFLLAHGHTPLGLLTAGRVIQTAVIVCLLLLLFWLMRRLLGKATAVAAVVLISFDPFFLGHSRLLNHEALLSLLVLVSLLALLTYLFLERKARLLVLSAVAAGFAQLTKSSSIVLLPAMGLLFGFDVLFHRRVGWMKKLPAALAEAGTWLAMVTLVYFVFWPGMWVAPGQMLMQVFGNAFSYAFEGSRLSVTGGVAPPPTPLALGGVTDYVQSMLWRTTPVIWMGTLLGVVALVRRDWAGRIVLFSVFLIGSLFVILFGVVSGRNSAHYVLTSYVSLDIVAAAGFVETADWLGGSLAGIPRRLVPVLILGAALVAQAASALLFFPYYYIYYNPIMEASQPGRGNPNFGYGEGLDLAASYLAAKPGAPESTVMAFYGRGPFSFFYPGRTEQLKPVYADAENVPQLKQVLHSSDYLVIYYELEKERESPANVMVALKGAIPDNIIWLNNIDYIHIYRVDLLPPQFYEALTP